MSSEELYVAMASRFWARQKSLPFKPVDVALYFHLLDKCYSLNWKSPFLHGNDFICEALGGVDTKTLIASRERLMSRGEIGFISGKYRKDLSEYALPDVVKVIAEKGGISPPLPENKGGISPPLAQEKGGEVPPLPAQKKPIAADLGTKGGKTPHNIESVNRTEELKDKKNTNTHEADPLAFGVFWDLYQKKVDHKKCQLKWDSLSAAQKTKALERIPAYVLATPDKRYRKDPLTYLNGENWNDEDLPTAKNAPTSTAPPPSLKNKLKAQRETVSL